MKKKSIRKSIVAILLCVVLAVSFAGCTDKTPPVANTFSLNKTILALIVGESDALTVNTNMAGDVEWSSSAAAVATINNSGLVTAVGAGESIIAAKLGDKIATCAVTVTIVDTFNPIVDGEVKFSYFPDLQKLEKIDVVKYDFGNNKHSQQGVKIFGEITTLAVLQGLLAKKPGNRNGLYLNVLEGGISAMASSTWLDEVISMSGATATAITDIENGATAYAQMLAKYKGDIAVTANNKPGYVLFKQEITDGTDNDNNPIQIGRQSVNAACTIAGATGFIAIEETSQALADSLGYEMAVDARLMTEIDAYNAYKANINKDIILLCNNGQAQNRDYGIAVGAYFMYESNKDNTFMNEITNATTGKYKQGTLAVGWSSTGEVNQVTRHAAYGFNFTCTNYSYNLSTMARVGKKSFQQRAVDENITAEAGKKYVTFIMTDGDNVTWHQNDFAFSEGWYNYPNRGDFKMGWTMAPIMADLAPEIIKKEYKMATKNDQFVCGVSGSGYIYPSEYGTQDEALTKLVDSTDEYMRRADLDYVEILDNRDFVPKIMNAYAAKDNIDGGFVLANRDYYRQGGDIKYFNGKPFMGIGESMWSDTAGRVAHRLNKLPSDITSANGYTAVKVHCWTSTMPMIADMVSKLDDNIVIVSPGEMMQLVKDNVKTDSKRTAQRDTNYPPSVDEYVDPVFFWNNTPLNTKTEINFDTFKDYEGTFIYKGAKEYDYASFSGEPWKYSTAPKTTVDGGAGYSIRLDGSDLGVADDSPNAAIYTKFKVPNSSNARFSFFARGMAYGYDAQYRVRIISKTGETPIIEKLDEAWNELGDNLWREVSYDVSDYKNQEIIFIIEHNSSHMEGDGEVIYVDNIKIGEETLNVSTMQNATKSKVTDFNFTSDVQGFKNVVANGGAVSHNASKGAIEVSVNGTNLANGGADAAIYNKLAMPTSTGFSHFKFGIWANAESGKTAQVRLAIVNGKQIVRAGMWTTVDSTAKYLSLDLDTYRIKGGALATANVIIEVRGAGSAAKVYLDNGNFAIRTRDFESGYLLDSEYFKGLSITDKSSLNNVSNWALEAGRGIEDEAIVTDGKIRLYGDDFMKGDDGASKSKGLGSFAKTSNEFNGRMFSKISVGTTANFKFDVLRLQKTKQGQNTTDPQIRVLFIEDDGTVTILKGFALLEDIATKTYTVSLSGIANKTGVIMVEMDTKTTGDKAGVLINNILFN